ncbi:MAG: DUF177 domain-containing protein [Candidatus Omnitrophota bacterium]
MKIDLTHVPQEGLELNESFAPEELDLGFIDIEFKRPIQINAKVTRFTNAVTVDADLSTEAESVCSRCLERFKMTINEKKRFNYLISDDKPVVDISEDIRQELILDYPIKILCRQDCKGLCPNCGKNLNLGSCDCKTN